MLTKGSCLCGAVAYEYVGDFVEVCICHCTMCQKNHASANAVYAYFAEPDKFRWLTGENHISRYLSSPPDGHRCFCAKCGSTLGFSLNQRTIGITLGTVDGDPGLRPTCHVYTEANAPWHDITDDLPQFEGLPDDFGNRQK